MYSIRYVLSKWVLKKLSDLLRIRSYGTARYLSDQGTWLPIRPAVSYVDTFHRPSVAEHLAHPQYFIQHEDCWIPGLLSLMATGLDLTTKLGLEALF